jgi:hypothetical protein
LAQASSAPAAPAPSVVPGPASGTGRSALRRSPPPLMREERRSPPSDLPPSLQLLRREAAKKRESRRFSKPTLLNWPTRFEARTTKPYAPRLVSSLVESEPGHVFIRPPACGRWGVPRQFRVEPRTRTQSPLPSPCCPPPSLSLFPPSPPEGREGEKCESERGRRAGIARRKRRNLASYHLPRVPQRRPLTGNLPRRTRTLGEEGGPPLRPPQPKGTRQGSASPAPFRTSEPESPPPPPKPTDPPLAPP